MSSSNLDNLVKAGQLKVEAFNIGEYKGLICFGQTSLTDATNESLSNESRFLLAYNAAHSFALAALRKCGYRASNRYIVFQVLTHTLGVESAECRILDLCHNRRNLAEYEGHHDVDSNLLSELFRVAVLLSEKMVTQ